MSRGQQTFKQRDVTKAIKATVKAGLPVERVEIDKGGKIKTAAMVMMSSFATSRPVVSQSKATTSPGGGFLKRKR